LKFVLRKIPVHPHVCGEHLEVEDGRDRVKGSSPRVWGTSGSSISRNSIGRFIPTCVGNIKDRPGIRIEPPVHPHVCGEHFYCDCSTEIQDGSSPRVWGT